MAPDQGKQVCEILIKLGWLETEHGLHAEGVRAIREALQCTTDDAKAILGDLRTRKLIDVDIAQGGELDARKPPVAKLRWIQPPTPDERIPAREG